MGSSQQPNPFADDKEPITPGTPETGEVPTSRPPVVDDYRRRVERIESDPNAEAAEAIRKLRGSKKIAEQEEGLTALNEALINVLVKLHKKNVDISKINNPDQLKREIIKNAIKLNIVEAVAVENLDRIAREGGETSTEIKNSWPDVVKTAQEGGLGWTAKCKKYFKKITWSKIVLLVVGATGIILGYKGIKALANKDKTSDKDKKSSWFKKEIAIPLIIVAAGAFLGRKVIAKILAEAGLDYFDLEDKVKKGKELTDEEKRKLQEASDKVQRRIREELDKRKKKTT